MKRDNNRSQWVIGGAILLLALVKLLWPLPAPQMLNADSLNLSASEPARSSLRGPIATVDSNQEANSVAHETRQAASVASPSFDRPINLTQLHAEAAWPKPRTDELHASRLWPQSHWRLWNGYIASRTEVPDSIGRLNGFTIVADPEFAAQENDFSKDQLFVVFNERTNVVGVVTGQIKLKLKNIASVPDLIEKYNLDLLSEFPHLQTYFVTAKEPRFDLALLGSRLKSDNRIESVEIEIVSHQHDKN